VVPAYGESMADEESDDEFEDCDDLDMASEWQEVGSGDSLDLDESWVTFLASADPPANAEGFDLSIPDFEGEDGDASAEENRYA